MGLPGLGNFVAEFLTLTGTFKSSVLFASLASAGLIAATIYSLRILQKVFYGKKNNEKVINDLSLRESVVMGLLVIAIVFTGLFPQPVLEKAEPSIIKTINAGKQQYNVAAEEIKKVIPLIESVAADE